AQAQAQAQAPPPGYFEEDLYLRKKASMRRWLCCTCQVEESNPPNDSNILKSPRNHADVFPPLAKLLI
ncbi:unnamed protein product, partial [Ilex paraguariensis]